MKKEFPGYFSSNKVDIDWLWEHCLFVLDANVLLNLYRYSDATRAELLNVFKSLSDRLWVPHQVVHEYLVNRLKVIGEQAKVYEDAVRGVENLRKGLESTNHHPFVTAATLADSVAVFEKLVVELNENKIVHEKRIYADEIKDHLEVLLEGKVGEGFDRDKMENVLSDGKIRYEQKIPPGYKDAKKGGESVVFSEMCKPYGDYIVWLQILEKARGSNKSVVFVTGDNKEDWWLSFQGKTVGPQPDLIEEFLKEANGSFYMYPPDRFLERANAFLQQETSQNAMNEIRSLRDEDDENEVNSALLDAAINASWPRSGADALEALLPWNEEYNRKVLEIHNLKRALMQTANEARLRLEIEKEIYKKNVSNYESLMSGNYGGVSVSILSELRDKVTCGKATIETVEGELTVLTDQIIELGKLRKSLAENFL